MRNVRGWIRIGLTATAAALALAAPASAQIVGKRMTVWAAPNLSLGDTKNALDFSAGVDVDFVRVGRLRVGGSLGYTHVKTDDAGNVHRFPLLALVRSDVGDPALATQLYVGAGLGVVFSDENSADIGVSRRTAPAFALMAGAETPGQTRFELRFVGSERPAKDGTFLFCVGLRL
jgi:hypothetical protein